ncbi:hypothetical protein [Acidovorax sp. SUPP3334]|uniref:hypothetical protein n=1 Tax=Acidovorax sp. SUPP3334 TaxID=2920881 RepID=UPI0023DE5A5F|nr:hypothetical protein [Acidovorax sp. SUPP3334]GKT20746.1 hypothetical protein AVHM3334_02240 [Acidovorax sp. SUPP3334]
MQDILGVAVFTAVEAVLLFTGKCVIRLASLGHWREENPDRIESRVFAAAGAFSFKRDGQRVFTFNGLLVAGILFYALVACALVWHLS